MLKIIFLIGFLGLSIVIGGRAWGDPYNIFTREDVFLGRAIAEQIFFPILPEMSLKYLPRDGET